MKNLLSSVIIFFISILTFSFFLFSNVKAQSSFSNTKFGIFYLTWHCPAQPSQDISKNQIGSYDSWHWWGEPKLGYYCLSNDDETLKIHAEMLRDIGLDFVYVDMTNHPHISGNGAEEMIVKPFQKMLEVWKNVPNAPKIVPWVPIPVTSQDPQQDMIQKVTNFMLDPKYENLWFKYQAKKLIIAVNYISQYNWTTANDNRISAIDSVWPNTFIIRKMWAWGPTQPTWSFFEACGNSSAFKSAEGNIDCQNQRVSIRNSRVEQIPVTFAYQQPCMNWDGVSIPKFEGRTFRKQFQTVFENIGVPIVTIASWNEWIVQRYSSESRNLNPNSPGYKTDCFMDAYNSEYNKDVEPANNEMGYYYNNLMKSCINLYKSGKTCNSAGTGSNMCCRDLDKSVTSKDKFGCNNNAICESYEDSTSCPNDCAPVVYPACGSAEGISTPVKPSTNLCKVGTVGTSGYGDGKWYWGCIGQNTGWKDDTAWCFAPKLETVVPACTASNWQSSISPITCPTNGQQVKTWTKVGNCTGGIQKPATENISCTSGIPTLNVVCSVTPKTTTTGTNVTWSSFGSTGGNKTYTYSWSGAATGTTAKVSKIYNTKGTKTATVTITSGSQIASATCNATVNEVIPTNLNGSCGSVSWDPLQDVNNYNLRINNLSNGWKGDCSVEQYPGDYCLSLTKTNYSFTPVAGADYKWWVHAKFNNVWGPSASSTFTCNPNSTTCTASNWQSSISPDICPATGQQVKTWTKVGNCTGGIQKPATDNISCTYIPEVSTCDFTYSDWTTCSTNGTKTRTVVTKTPSNCTDGSPVLSGRCEYKAPTINSGRSGGGGGGSSSTPKPTIPIVTPVINQGQNSSLQICQFIEILITIGAIAPDKANTARALFPCTTTSVESNPLPINSSVSKPLITAYLYPEIRHPEVKVLKTFLNKYNYLTDTTGTDYYGPLTTEAVQKFQRTNNIISSGTPNTTGYGAVGPKTRELINNWK